MYYYKYARYQVIVGNLGTVIKTDDFSEATETFNHYVDLSNAGYGRCAGEDVYLFDDVEPIQEFTGKYQESE